MDKLLYPMIYKRKSFHKFKDIGTISDSELSTIRNMFAEVEPLYKDIKIDIKLVKPEETNCRRGAEYCIMFYSEKKDGALQNIGYIGEQLDLKLASMNIGCLWYGLGRAKEKKSSGLDYVIMLAIAKVNESDFRKDMFKAKRKAISEMWTGEHHSAIANIARFAPSACNLQPWMVKAEKDSLLVCRYKKPGIHGIIPPPLVPHFNRIDIGIFMCILEVCLANDNKDFTRELFSDYGSKIGERIPNAKYRF